MKPKWLFMVAVASVLAALAIIGSSALAQGPVPQNGNPPPTATPVVADQPVVTGGVPQSPTGGGGPGPVSTYFSYQGQLKSGNTPVNGYCDFVFSLWDQSGTGQPPSGGIQIGTTLTQTNLSVANGLFNSTLSFGTTAFNGEARWLQIAVRCPAGSAQAYTILSPRQPLWATPYALSLRPGTVVEGSQSNWNVIYASNIATANLSYGIRALSSSPLGRGVSGESNTAGGMGVYGFSTAGGGAGVAGYIGSNSIDVDTFDTQKYGVFGKSASNTGVGVMGLSGTALVTDTHPSNSYWQAGGEFSGRNGIIGATSGANDGYAVLGIATSSSSTRAIVGVKIGGGDYAGYFSGNVQVTGNLSASGTKPFKIDNPLDPANQYLYHYAVESPQVQNVYNGTITLNAKGEAVITLPAYFSTVNTGEYRYYLTPIGAPMPNLYVAEEINGNTWKIAGGVAGKKVSWMVYGLRNDPWLRDNPQQDVVNKPPTEVGTYAYPQGYGQPESAGLPYQQLQPQTTYTTTTPDLTPQVPPAIGSNSTSGAPVQP